MVLSIGWLLGSGVLRAGEPGERPSGGPGPQMYPLPFLPAYQGLLTEQVQKELELVPEQVQKLEELAKKYAEELDQERRGQDWAKWRELSDEQRRQRWNEIRQRSEKRNEEFKRQIEAVLLPHQIERAKQKEVRQRMGWMLYSAATLERLQLTPQQRDKVVAIRNEMQQKLVQTQAQIQAEMLEKILEQLNPEQRKQLEDWAAQPGRRNPNP
jgi:hypothetical protein